MSTFPTPKVHRPARNKLGRGQHIQHNLVTATVVASGDTFTLTFSSSVVVSGDLDIVPNGRTLVSQAQTLSNTVVLTYNGTVSGIGYAGLPPLFPGVVSNLGALFAGIPAFDVSPAGLLAITTGFWYMGEAGGSPRADSTGHGNTLTESGGDVPQAAGLVGECASFSGGGQPFLAISSGLIPATGPAYISMWMKTATLQTGTGYIILSQNGATASQQLAVLSSSVGYLAKIHGSFFTGSGSEFTANNWFHLLIVSDPAGAGLVDAYVNGVKVGSGSTGAAGGASTLTHVGAAFDLSGNAFNGLLQYLSIGNAVLTMPQILALWNGGTPLPFSSYS